MKSFPKIWLKPLAFLLGAIVAVVVGINSGQHSVSAGVDLVKARADFTTTIIPSAYRADGVAATPPPEIFSVVRYPSAVGNLVAYLSPKPIDNKKHPAVLWAHGGFGGIGSWLWDKNDEQAPSAFQKAGFVVMTPSWRGENDNPGRFELFYGEVLDAVAAIEYLAKVPYVDPDRIYMVGHSTGGTITLLTAQVTAKLRAAFSFGGAPDLQTVVGDGSNDITPFDYRNAEEVRLRSPINFVNSLKVPTFYFEGQESAYPEDAKKMAALVQKVKKPFQAFIVTNGDHFNILQPLCKMIAQKIHADTKAAKKPIAISANEVSQAFASRQ